MNVSAVDLNLFLVLHLVLKEQSVVGAARRLHVTAPAVSNALARLRHLLGDPLFTRHGRKLIPTPRAQAIRPALEGAMERLQSALDGAGQWVPAITDRTFNLACSDADQICSVPALAEAFVQRMPHAKLRLSSIDQLEASGGLGAGQVDVAIGPLPFQTEVELHTSPLYEDEGALLVRRAHPSVGRTLSPKQFNALRHIDLYLALGKPGQGHRLAEAYFEKHGLRRSIGLTVTSFSAAAMIAASTDLVAAMPLRLAERFEAILPVKRVRLPIPPLVFSMGMIWHARSHLDLGCQEFRRLIQQTFNPTYSDPNRSSRRSRKRSPQTAESPP